jgi:hypothetical protein
MLLRLSPQCRWVDASAIKLIGVANQLAIEPRGRVDFRMELHSEEVAPNSEFLVAARVCLRKTIYFQPVAETAALISDAISCPPRQMPSVGRPVARHPRMRSSSCSRSGYFSVS